MHLSSAFLLRCFLLVPFGTAAAIRRSATSSIAKSSPSVTEASSKSSSTKSSSNKSSKGKGRVKWYYELPPTIYLGFGISDTGRPYPDVPLPLTVDEAVAMDWEFNETSERWLSTDVDLPHVLLTFEEEYLSGITVVAPASPLLAPLDNGVVEVSFKDDSDRFSLVVNKVGIPLTSMKAERDNWNEGGCVEYMGGSHYYKFQLDDDWTTMFPVVPIYNKYGTNEGDLSNIMFTCNDGVFPSDGFDFKGFSLNKIFACDFTFCSDPNCIAHFNSNTDVVGFSTMHIFFSNPEYPSNWGECQAPLGSCAVPDCSCCGSRDNQSGPRSCTSAF